MTIFVRFSSSLKKPGGDSDDRYQKGEKCNIRTNNPFNNRGSRSFDFNVHSGFKTVKVGFSRNTVHGNTLRRDVDQGSEDARTDRKQCNHDSNQAYFTFCHFYIALRHFSVTFCCIRTKAFKGGVHSLKRCFGLCMFGIHPLLQYGNSFLKFASVRRVIHEFIISIGSQHVKSYQRDIIISQYTCFIVVLVMFLMSTSMASAAPPPASGTTEAWLDQVERSFAQHPGNRILRPDLVTPQAHKYGGPNGSESQPSQNDSVNSK